MISIIIPVYNSEYNLTKCVMSIIEQMGVDDEIILVNDGSTDGSLRLCNEFSSRFKNIHILNQSNMGALVARQNGLKIASNPYVWFVDSDDYIVDESIIQIKEILNTYKPDLLYFDYLRDTGEKLLANDNCCLRISGLIDSNKIETDVVPRMLYNGGFYNFGIEPSLWNKVINRKIAQQAFNNIVSGIFMGEDGFIVYQCIMSAKTLYRLDESIYVYHDTESSVTNNRNRDLFTQNEILFSAWEIYLKTYLNNETNRRQFNCYKLYLNWFAIEDEFVRLFLHNNHRNLIRCIGLLKRRYNECMNRDDIRVSDWTDLSKPQLIKILLLKNDHLLLLYYIWIFGNYRNLIRMRGDLRDNHLKPEV